MNSNRPKTEELIQDIERVARELGVEPWNLTRARYLNGGAGYSEWFTRGYAQLIQDYYKRELNEESDVLAIRGSSSRNKYTTRLERRLGDVLYSESRVEDLIKRVFQVSPVVINEPDPTAKLHETKEINRWNIIHLSDTHMGQIVDPLEVEGNQYNWQVFARKLGKIASNVANFKLDHRPEVEGLVITIAGDMVQGAIHSDDVNQDLMIYQFAGAVKNFAAFISYQRKFYKKIVVVSTTGNHDRLLTGTKGKSRATAQKFDSYQTMFVMALQQAFIRDAAVEFIVPKTPYSVFTLFGRNFWTTHGDTFIVLGNPEKSIDVGKIAAQIDKINSSLADRDRMECLLMGHVHSSVRIGLPNDVDVFINPSLSGAQPFSQFMGKLKDRTGCWLIESTKDYRIGDSRMIWVDDATNDESYEEIIEPYDYRLVFDKINE